MVLSLTHRRGNSNDRSPSNNRRTRRGSVKNARSWPRSGNINGRRAGEFCSTPEELRRGRVLGGHSNPQRHRVDGRSNQKMDTAISDQRVVHGTPTPQHKRGRLDHPRKSNREVSPRIAGGMVNGGRGLPRQTTGHASSVYFPPGGGIISQSVHERTNRKLGIMQQHGGTAHIHKRMQTSTGQQ